MWQAVVSFVVSSVSLWLVLQRNHWRLRIRPLFRPVVSNQISWGCSRALGRRRHAQTLERSWIAAIACDGEELLPTGQPAAGQG